MRYFLSNETKFLFYLNVDLFNSDLDTYFGSVIFCVNGPEVYGSAKQTF